MRLKHKFNAKRCKFDDIKFPSILEKNCYLVLKQMKKDNEILFFLRQVAFDLPGKYKHQVDFCVFTLQNVIFIEAKGRDLPIGKLKRKQVEELFNIEIFVVKSAAEITKVLKENDDN